MLIAPVDAAKESIITPIFVSPSKRISPVAHKAGLGMGSIEVVDVASEEAAAAPAPTHPWLRPPAIYRSAQLPS
jgi:hypothetical protein